ncbi:DMT family transporter [Pikeienuella sp. HZG-20]|uniref:DMT family transporter n=1 Tax=Paludibacillus litoralis TaxID=3133267 RepID=UPI0030EDA608
MRPTTFALLLMTMSALLIPVGDAFAKVVAQATSIEPIVVAFFRFAVGAAIFLPLALARRQFPALTPRFVVAQLLRGMFVVGGIVSMVTAVSYAPLADVFGAFFIAPAIATLLAATVLKERVTALDLLSLLFGLVGVLMVTRPGAGMNVGLLWALAGGASYGCFNAATRWSAPFTPPLAQIASQLVIGTLITFPFALGGMGAATEGPWLLLGSGLGSAAANFCLVAAYARERAAVLSPLIYLQLPSAALIGLAVFSDFPDALAAAGLALIVVTGIGIRLFAGFRAARPKAAPPPQP